MKDGGIRLLSFLTNAHHSLIEAELWAAENDEPGFQDEIDAAEARVRGIIRNIERLRDDD